MSMRASHPPTLTVEIESRGGAELGCEVRAVYACVTPTHTRGSPTFHRAEALLCPRPCPGHNCLTHFGGAQIRKIRSALPTFQASQIK